MPICPCCGVEQSNWDIPDDDGMIDTGNDQLVTLICEECGYEDTIEG